MLDEDVNEAVTAGYTWWQSASLKRIRDSGSQLLDVANGLDAVITIDVGDVSIRPN